MNKMSGKFLIIFLLTVNIFANITANVDKQNVIQGDNITYSITADGNKIIFPKIDKIVGFNIESIANSQSISIINNNYQKKLTRSWSFTPLKSITIPSYIVKIDNKEYRTKPIKISVVKDSKFNEKFKLEVNVSKNVIVGYPTLVNVKFYQKTNTKVSEIQLNIPKGNFELKSVGKEKDYYEGVYKVAEIKYILIPKQKGVIDFNLALKLGFIKTVKENFFTREVMKYKTIAKNTKINVSKVYDGFVGDFNISMNVNKTKIRENKPLNGKLIIEGYGNLNNLSDIKIEIPSATIYKNKPKISQIIKNNRVYSRYEKSFVILAENNYTIPAVEFSYYNIKDKQEKNITTKSISVEVIKDKNNQLPTTLNKTEAKTKIITKEVVKYKNNYLFMGIIFIIGIIVGYLLKIFKIKQNLKFKLPKNLYNRLLIYADDPKIKIILEKLYRKENLKKEEKEFIKEFFADKRSNKD